MLQSFSVDDCSDHQILERLGRRRDALEMYNRACALAPTSAAVKFKKVKLLVALRLYSVRAVFRQCSPDS